jgi:hypothetical protein
MATNITKNELSEFTPSWLDMNFPNDEEYISVKDVIMFYLINCPCERSSSRGIDISLWGKTNIVLWKKIKLELGLEKEKNYEYGNSKPKMKELFHKYNMGCDFTNIVTDTVVFLNDQNVFESMFKHIRNAIAHSRWQVINNIYYFEDGSDDIVDKVKYFSVTARIVLRKETLLKLRDLIITGPSDKEIEKINFNQMTDGMFEKLKDKFKDGNFTRKEAVTLLGIDNSMWIRLYKKGKEDGVMSFKANKWQMKKPL